MLHPHRPGTSVVWHGLRGLAESGHLQQRRASSLYKVRLLGLPLGPTQPNFPQHLFLPPAPGEARSVSAAVWVSMLVRVPHCQLCYCWGLNKETQELSVGIP